MKWIFNKNYKDYKQVEQFYNLFIKLYDEITSQEGYPYNSLFEDKLDIDDKEEEKTAIYLLQKSRTEKSRERKIENLLNEGFKRITKGEGIKKFVKIIQVGTDYSVDSIKEFDNGRIVFKAGYIYGILPKGHKTTGSFVYSDNLIFGK